MDELLSENLIQQPHSFLFSTGSSCPAAAAQRPDPLRGHRRRPGSGSWRARPAPREPWPACTAAVARHRLGAGAPAAGPWEPGGGLRGPRAEAPVGAPQQAAGPRPKLSGGLLMRSEEERRENSEAVGFSDQPPPFIYDARSVISHPIVTNG